MDTNYWEVIETKEGNYLYAEKYSNGYFYCFVQKKGKIIFRTYDPEKAVSYKNSLKVE